MNGQEFEEHRPFLTALANKKLPRKLRGRMDPEDLVQEAALSLCRGKALYDPTQGELRAYLGVVVSRRAYQAARVHNEPKRSPAKEARENPESPWQLSGREWDPTLVAEMNETLEAIGGPQGDSDEKDALLGPRDRLVLSLLANGKSLAEVAGMIGVCRERVRQIRVEAEQKLAGRGPEAQARPARQKISLGII